MNLRFSRRGDYVLRSAICLAQAYESGEPTKLRQISADMEVPRTFASQILGDLVRAGLAVSSFGAHGGYRLARPPEAVTLLDVIEAGEGPLLSECCALGQGPCRWEAVCPLHESWVAATSAMRASLAGTTLAELADRDRALSGGTYPVPLDAHRSRPALPVLGARRGAGAVRSPCRHWTPPAPGDKEPSPLGAA